MLILKIESRGKKIVVFIKKKNLYIGRDEDNDIIINHHSVSRKHLKLSFIGGKWYITDLNSKNGTYISNQRINNELYLLKNDDSGIIGADIFVSFKIENSSKIKATKLPLKIDFEKDETEDSNLYSTIKKELINILSLESEKDITEKLKKVMKILGIKVYGIFEEIGAKKNFIIKFGEIPVEVKEFKGVNNNFVQTNKYAIELLWESKDKAYFYVFFENTPLPLKLIKDIKSVLKVIYIHKIKNEILLSQKLLINSHELEKNFIFASERMKEVIRKAIKYAATGYHILIEGETGTGKEIIAELIRKESPRREKPFEISHIAGIETGVIDSELFGHKKGSFTGAIADHTGIFERNNGGIIFIDEVSLLPLKVQEKLLRTVEYGDIYPIGGKPKKVDVQIIFATNENLEKLVEEGKFRKDLYYRISALKISIPPLRERIDDIIPISEYYLKLFLLSFGKKYKGISEEAKEMLIDYPWGGNVRELKNDMLLIATNLEKETIIKICHLPEKILNYYSKSYKDVTDTSIENIKKEIEKKENEMIKKALVLADGNKSRAAKILGRSRSWLIKKLKKIKV